MGELRPRGDFDFSLALRYQLRRTREPVDRQGAGAYRRVVRLPGGPALLEARPDHPSRTRLLEIRSLSRRLGADERAAALAQMSRIYSLDFNLGAFYRHARRDPVLAGLVGRLKGLRVASIPDPFESLVWAILGQQITLSFAVTLKSRLVEWAGEWVEHGGERYSCFPTPESLAAAGQEELTGLGLSEAKARYVRHLAARVCDGLLDLEGLRELAPEERRARLLDLTGVGPWTAAYVALRSYGDADALPVGDVGLEAAATEAYGAPKRIKGRALEALAEAWRPYRGWVTFYLWNANLDRAAPAARG